MLPSLSLYIDSRNKADNDIFNIDIAVVEDGKDGNNADISDPEDNDREDNTIPPITSSPSSSSKQSSFLSSLFCCTSSKGTTDAVITSPPSIANQSDNAIETCKL